MNEVKALYKVTTNANATASLQIFGEIGANGFSLKDFKNAVGGLEVSALDIDLNSPGGDPFEAFAIHDAIKAMNARVTVNIIGVAASAATIIAAAADRVTMTENSRYLIHEASTIAQGKRADIEATGEMLGKIDAQMLSVYVKRTGKQASELQSLMQKDNFISAQEALEWGFVDEIIGVSTNTIAAMATEKKVTAMSDEEKEKYEAMEKDNADLKSKIAAMQEELDALKAKAEEKLDEEIDETVDAAIAEEKFDKEAKATLTAIGKTNGIEALKATIKAVKAPTASVLAGVVKGKDPNALAAADVKAMTFQQKFELYKAGKITMKQMEE